MCVDDPVGHRSAHRRLEQPRRLRSAVRPPVTDPVLARRRFASRAVRPINAAFHARIAEDLGDGYRTARRRTPRSSARTGT